MTRRSRLLLNAGLFQLGWFACIVAASRTEWLLVAILCLVAHMIWVAENCAEEWSMLLRVAAIGWVLDSILMYVGVFQFRTTPLLPLWLMLLWLLFASTLRYSLQWTARPWWLSSIVGACCGPLSYLAGARLADVGLPLGQWTSFILLALIWALLLPALHYLTGKRAT